MQMFLNFAVYRDIANCFGRLTASAVLADEFSTSKKGKVSEFGCIFCCYFFNRFINFIDIVLALFEKINNTHKIYKQYFWMKIAVVNVILNENYTYLLTAY